MSDTHLAIAGNFSIECVADIKARMDALLMQAQAGQVALDLSDVQEFDGAGMQLLLAFDQAVRAGGLQLQLLAPAPAVTGVLQRFGLAARFGLQEDA